MFHSKTKSLLKSIQVRLLAHCFRHLAQGVNHENKGNFRGGSPAHRIDFNLVSAVNADSTLVPAAVNSTDYAVEFAKPPAPVKSENENRIKPNY